MPSTDPHEVERVEEWPAITLGRNLGGGPFIRTSPRPPEEEQTYYPASAPNVLSPDEATVLCKLYELGWDALTAGECDVLSPLVVRLSLYAKDPKGVTDGSD